MPRKSHRRSAHRKGSRSAHRKSHRKHQSRRSHSRRNGNYNTQRGGSCAAMPTNREAFAQRGGMAPFDTLNNGYLLDQATRVQAEVAPLDKAIAELPAVIRPQSGGRRKSHKGRKAHRKSQKSHRSSRRSQKSRRNHRSRRNHKQRGGDLQAFGADYMLLPKGTPIGANPQFQTEGSVNPLYSEYAGPQA